MVAFRVDDELWVAALARAKSEGTSVSAVLREALAAWVRGETPVAEAKASAAPVADRSGSRACPTCGKQRRFVVGRLVCPDHG